MIINLTYEQFKKFWFPIQEITDDAGEVEERIQYWKKNLQQKYHLKYNEIDSDTLDNDSHMDNLEQYHESVGVYGMLEGSESHINWFILSLK